MNNYITIFKHYLYNVSIFRRRYFIYKTIGKDMFYVKTSRIFTKSYFVHPIILDIKVRNLQNVLNSCENNSLLEAQNTIKAHIKRVKKVYLRVRQVYEE